MTSTVSAVSTRATRSSRKSSTAPGQLASHPPGGLVYRDEEVDSVEADGAPPDLDVPEGGHAERQQLTAALVTSIVESAGSSGAKKAAPSPRRSLRHRTAAKDDTSPQSNRGMLPPPPKSVGAAPNHVAPRTTRRTNAAASSVAPPKASARPSRKRKQSPLPPPTGPQSNPTAVPNPLAGGARDPSPVAFAPAPAPVARNERVADTTATLMSAAPHCSAPVASHAPATSSGFAAQVGQLANMSESMASSASQPPPTGSNSDLAPAPVPAQARGRIFSIDLDPAVLDFVDAVDLGHNDPADAAKRPSVTFKEDGEAGSGPGGFGRDRGFSFEFNRRDRGFSFDLFPLGLKEDEPLPPVPSALVDGAGGAREGGQHEMGSAPLHGKREDGGDGMEVNASGVAQHLPALADEGAHHAAHEPSRRGRPPKTRSKATFNVPKLPPLPPSQPSTVSASTASSSSAQQPLPDVTLRMPNGSDAAAAAAAGLRPPSPAPGTDAISITHTACSMELLNKDGRIGIYLPEERKARIAKFHAKRKARIWKKRIKYDCRKKLADGRPRVKGRFVKRLP